MMLTWKTVQQLLLCAAFEPSLTDIAWKTIPSWFLVTQNDRAINPKLQRFMAHRIGARTTEVPSSRVPFVSHPNEVAQLIEAAATYGSSN